MSKDKKKAIYASFEKLDRKNSIDEDLTYKDEDDSIEELVKKLKSIDEDLKKDYDDGKELTVYLHQLDSDNLPCYYKSVKVVKDGDDDDDFDVDEIEEIDLPEDFKPWSDDSDESDEDDEENEKEDEDEEEDDKDDDSEVEDESDEADDDEDEEEKEDSEEDGEEEDKDEEEADEEDSSDDVRKVEEAVSLIDPLYALCESELVSPIAIEDAIAALEAVVGKKTYQQAKDDMKKANRDVKKYFKYQAHYGQNVPEEDQEMYNNNSIHDLIKKKDAARAHYNKVALDYERRRADAKRRLNAYRKDKAMQKLNSMKDSVLDKVNSIGQPKPAMATVHETAALLEKMCERNFIGEDLCIEMESALYAADIMIQSGICDVVTESMLMESVGYVEEVSDMLLNVYSESNELSDWQREGLLLVESYMFEKTLKAKDRNKLDDSEFGIPSLRKYPIHDKAHVSAAIQRFNHVDTKHEKELARNIIKAMKKFGMMNEVEVSDKNRFKKYLSDSEKAFKESFDLYPFPAELTKEFSVGSMLPMMGSTDGWGTKLANTSIEDVVSAGNKDLAKYATLYDTTELYNDALTERKKLYSGTSFDEKMTDGLVTFEAPMLNLFSKRAGNKDDSYKIYNDTDGVLMLNNISGIVYKATDDMNYKNACIDIMNVAIRSIYTELSPAFTTGNSIYHGAYDYEPLLKGSLIGALDIRKLIPFANKEAMKLGAPNTEEYNKAYAKYFETILNVILNFVDTVNDQLNMKYINTRAARDITKLRNTFRSVNSTISDLLKDVPQIQILGYDGLVRGVYNIIIPIYSVNFYGFSYKHRRKFESVDDIAYESVIPRRNPEFDEEAKKLVKALKEYIDNPKNAFMEDIMKKALNFKKTIYTIHLRNQTGTDSNPIIKKIESCGYKEVSDEGVKATYEKSCKNIVVNVFYDAVSDKLRITYDEKNSDVPSYHKDAIKKESVEDVMLEKFSLFKKKDNPVICTDEKLVDKAYKSAIKVSTKSENRNEAMMTADDNMLAVAAWYELYKIPSHDKVNPSDWNSFLVDFLSDVNEKLKKDHLLVSADGDWDEGDISCYTINGSMKDAHETDIDSDIADVIKKLNALGYCTKYSCSGHVNARFKKDIYKDGVLNDHLYTTARIVFADDYKLKPPVGWVLKDFDDGFGIYPEPKRFKFTDGNPMMAFDTWKDEYMKSLKEWVNSLDEKPGPKEEEVKKESFLDSYLYDIGSYLSEV